MNYAAALTTPTHDEIAAHLLQHTRDEDVCFALYRPSRGTARVTGVVSEPILPVEGDRSVHRNASVSAAYFERALGIALREGAGLAFLHSHTRRSHGWQDMSRDDVDTERIYAPRAQAMTGLPVLGLTIAGDSFWSARFWEKVGRGEYVRRDCESVRVVGGTLQMSFHPQLKPAPAPSAQLTRTVAAWGDAIQADLARLHVGVVGLGSVGSVIAEALVRTGVAQLTLMDFDSVELHNLDRLLNATQSDLGRAKVDVARDALLLHATAAKPSIAALQWSVVEEDGFRAALDCDVLFSCVDRPWPRETLNLAAFAHLVPVIDGGIRVRMKSNGKMRSADWKAHVVAPGRRCLECLEQFNPAFVVLERQGDLDDPTYIDSLPVGHSLRASENVFAFGMAAASLELMQFLQMVVAPGGVDEVGSQHYNFKTGEIDREIRGCNPGCPYTERLVAQGDQAFFASVGDHQVAREARAARLAAAAERLGRPTGSLRVLIRHLAGWLREFVRDSRLTFSSGRRR